MRLPPSQAKTECRHALAQISKELKNHFDPVLDLIYCDYQMQHGEWIGPNPQEQPEPTEEKPESPIVEDAIKYAERNQGMIKISKFAEEIQPRYYPGRSVTSATASVKKIIAKNERFRKAFNGTYTTTFKRA